MGIITGVVVGVVVALAGAVTNYFLTKWRDERHWEREDEIRFQRERLEAYVKLLRTVQHGGSFPGSALTTVEGWREYLTVFFEGFREISLIGSPSVRDAAQKLFRAHALATGQPFTDPLTEEERSTDPRTLRTCRLNEFIEEIRKELKIPEPISLD